MRSLLYIGISLWFLFPFVSHAQESTDPSPSTLQAINQGEPLTEISTPELQLYLDTQRSNPAKRGHVVSEFAARFLAASSQGQPDPNLLSLMLPYLDESGRRALSGQVAQSILQKAPGETTSQVLVRVDEKILAILSSDAHVNQGRWVREDLIRSLGQVIEYGRLTNAGAHPSVLLAWRLAFNVALPEQAPMLERLLKSVEKYPVARRARDLAFPEAISTNQVFVPENIASGKHPYVTHPSAQPQESLLPEEMLHLWPSSVSESLNQARSMFTGQERRLQIQVGLEEVLSLKRTLNLLVTTKQPIPPDLVAAIYNLARRYGLRPFPQEVPTRTNLTNLNAKLRSQGEGNHPTGLLEEKLTVQLLRIQNIPQTQIRSQIPAMLEGVEGTLSRLYEGSYPLPQETDSQGRRTTTLRVRKIPVRLLDGTELTIKASVPTTIHFRDQAAAVRAQQHMRERRSQETETTLAWVKQLQSSLDLLNRLRFENLTPKQIATLEGQADRSVQGVLEEIPETKIGGKLQAATDLSTVIGPRGYIRKHAYREAQARIHSALKQLDYSGQLRSTANLERWSERTEAQRKSEWNQLRHAARSIREEINRLENPELSVPERASSVRTLFSLIHEAKTLSQIPDNLLPAGWENTRQMDFELGETEQTYRRVEQAIQAIELLAAKVESFRASLLPARAYFSSKNLTIWVGLIDEISERWAQFGKPGFVAREVIEETEARLGDMRAGLEASDRIKYGTGFYRALSRHLSTCAEALADFRITRSQVYPRTRATVRGSIQELDTLDLDKTLRLLKNQQSTLLEQLNSRLRQLPSIQTLNDFHRLLQDLTGVAKPRPRDVSLYSVIIPGPWLEPPPPEPEPTEKIKETVRRGAQAMGRALTSGPIAGAGAYAVGEYGANALEAWVTGDPMVARRLTLSHVLDNLGGVYVPLEIGSQVGGVASRRLWGADLKTPGMKGVSARATRLWFALLAVELAQGQVNWGNQPRQMGNIVTASFVVNRSIRLIKYGFSGLHIAATGWKAKSLGTLSLLEIPLSVIAEFSLIRLENWVEDKLLEKWQVKDLKNKLADRMMEFDEKLFCSTKDPSMGELGEWMAPVGEAFQHYYAYQEIISPLAKAHAEFQMEKDHLSEDLRYWEKIKRDYDQAALTGAPVGAGIMINGELSYGFLNYSGTTIHDNLKGAQDEFKEELDSLTTAYEAKKKPLLAAFEKARQHENTSPVEFSIPLHPRLEDLTDDLEDEAMVAQDFNEDDQSWKDYLRGQVAQQISQHSWNMNQEMESFFDDRFLAISSMDFLDRGPEICQFWSSTPAMNTLRRIDWHRR